MNAILIGKIVSVILAFLFCAIPAHISIHHAAFCLFLCAMFLYRIPGDQRKRILILVPFIITIAGMQFLSSSQPREYQQIAITAFKIFCTGSIVISARFFIGTEAVKWLAHALPHSASIFLLIFLRTFHYMLRLNRMIIFQLSSRLNLASKEKYYIPKYYSIAMLYNQFRAMHTYRNGFLSRSVDKILEPEIFFSESSFDRALAVLVIIIVSLYIILNA